MMDQIQSPLKLDKSGWFAVRFGDVVFEPKETVKDPVVEGVEHVVGLEHIDSENIHLQRSASIEESTTFTKKFAVGDVLFGRRRAYLKKAAQASFAGICSGDITVFRAKGELSPRLLPFIVQNENFFDYAIKHSAGGLSPRVKFKDLANYEFLLPPKPQQAELAELLWAMDEVIERELELQSQVSLSRQSYFSETIEREAGKTVPLSKVLIPKKGKSQVPHKLERYIGLEHIDSGSFLCDKYDNSAEMLAQCNVIKEGDLCYSKLRPYLDKAFIATFDTVSTTELLVYDTLSVSKEYILHVLHSKSFIEYVSGKGFGTKMPRINQKIIGEFKVKILKNENILMKSIKGYLDAEQKVKEKILQSRSLQKSLINQVFS